MILMSCFSREIVRETFGNSTIMTPNSCAEPLIALQPLLLGFASSHLCNEHCEISWGTRKIYIILIGCKFLFIFFYLYKNKTM